MANNVPIAKAKKGDTVLLCMFTGCKTGIKKIVACDKNTVTLEAGRSGELTFDRKTGKQIEPMPKKERYASFIVPDDGTFVPASRKKKTKPEKKTTKKAKPEEAEEKKEEPAPKKEKKAAAPKKSKPIPKPEPVDEDEDDDWDDDDFEEVE